MCILRFARKDQLCFTKSLRFHVSMRNDLFNAAVRGLVGYFIHRIYRTGPIAAERLIYHQWPFRGPRGHRTVAVRHPWIPFNRLGTYFIYERKSAKIIAQCPVGIRADHFKYATHRVLNRLFAGCLFDENARRIGSRLFDTPAPVWWLKLTRRPWNQKGAGRALYGNGQNIHFYSPFGGRERSSNMKMWFEIFLYRVRAVPGGYREDFPDREGDSCIGRLPVKPGGWQPMTQQWT